MALRCVLVVLMVVTAGCDAGVAPASSTPATSDSVLTTTTSQVSPSTTTGRVSGDPSESFASALRSLGVSVEREAEIGTSVFGGDGTRLCVDGEALLVYAYGDDESHRGVVSSINRSDPSRIGASSVAWAGDPMLWSGDRIIVVYLGEDETIRQLVSRVLGEPFATGRGRDARSRGAVCGDQLRGFEVDVVASDQVVPLVFRYDQRLGLATWMESDPMSAIGQDMVTLDLAERVDRAEVVLVVDVLEIGSPLLNAPDQVWWAVRHTEEEQVMVQVGMDAWVRVVGVVKNASPSGTIELRDDRDSDVSPGVVSPSPIPAVGGEMSIWVNGGLAQVTVPAEEWNAYVNDWGAFPPNHTFFLEAPEPMPDEFEMVIGYPADMALAEGGRFVVFLQEWEIPQRDGSHRGVWLGNFTVSQAQLLVDSETLTLVEPFGQSYTANKFAAAASQAHRVNLDEVARVFEVSPDWGPLTVVDQSTLFGWQAGVAAGTLHITETCVTVDERVTLVWRAGETRWDPEEQAIVWSGFAQPMQTLRHGDRVAVGGGWSPTIGPYVTDIHPDCPADRGMVHSISTSN